MTSDNKNLLVTLLCVIPVLLLVGMLFMDKPSKEQARMNALEYHLAYCERKTDPGLERMKCTTEAFENFIK